MKQTAVEFLIQQIVNRINSNSISRPLNEIYEQALELEKQQIIDAFNAGVNSEDFFCPPFEISESEQYYNETYKPST
jgi:hypothetical protein